MSSTPPRPIVFMDVHIGETPAGRMKMELFSDITPKLFVKSDGTGSFSIYGEKFFFFITTAKCDFLDGKHVVFGRVIDGMLTLRKIEHVPTGPNNRPKLTVKIVERGEM
ncbi:hypothetical protein M378DRAFT_190354 [Amanita muscaria Koide BX008]|uniref:peptidylprolyl isomerase n=1 Tax=Amanita muscaria (strain Koide BX008) TaxID=946122 RepID=A0A0C2X479_AMAMK|nr:hypothetical protein M378DRAFT_190354 [Amanita muscaria Koide BX008]